MTRILILSYYWPPAGGPGVQRWVKMSNQLINLGYEVTVITVQNGSYPSIDQSLLSEVDPKIEVIKTKTIEPFTIFNRLRGKKGKEATVGMIGLSDRKSILQRVAVYVRANFFIPDARKGWYKYAYAASSKAVKEKDFDVIISTGPPHSVHAVAQRIQRKYKLKWIADLRDPWVNIHYHSQMPLGKRALRKHQKLEDSVLRTADAVTVVSQGMKREFEGRAKRIDVIYNGYDEQDFESIAEPLPNSKFTIRYTGNLKPNQDVAALWQALRELCAEEPDFKEGINIELIGKKDPKILARNQSQLPIGIIRSIDSLPHGKAVEKMCSADLLLFIIPLAKNNDLILTGKLFEYLASRSPLLSIGPPAGDAAHILAKAGRDAMLNYDDSKSIKERIQFHFKNWKTRSSNPSPLEESRYTQFSRKVQSQHYSDLISEIISPE